MNLSLDRIDSYKREAGSLAASLEPRMAVEAHFAALGHTYRHGKLYRRFEHTVTRPLLRSCLQLAGLYQRGMRNALSPEIRRIDMPIAGLTAELDGFEILHLSDFHLDGTPALSSALAGLLRGLRPDVCLMTGDYRYEDHGPCEPLYPLMREVIESIHARLGIFGILGNHDASEIAVRLEEMGVRLLVNEAVEVGSFDTPLWLVGVDDPFDFHTHDLPRALAGAPRDSFRILMAHAPEIFEEAAQAGVDLYLAGHTHAGQIRFPGIGALRMNAHCPRSYAYGHWQHRRMHGYTSAGVGCSTLPVRFNCPPEIAVITLRRRLET